MANGLPADFGGWIEEPPQPAQAPTPQPTAAPPAVGYPPEPPRRPIDLGGAPAPVSEYPGGAPPQPVARPKDVGVQLPLDFGGWIDEPPSMGDVIKEAGLRGLREGFKSAREGMDVVARGGFDKNVPQPEQDETPVGKLLRAPLAEGWKDPNWWAAHIASGITGASPSLGLGAAGAAGGSLAAGPVGGLAGGAVGFGAGAALQSVAPAYQKARLEGLDHDAAVDRAIKETGIAAAFGTAMGLAPGVSIFGKTAEGALKAPISEALAQIFVAQPGLMMGQKASENVVEGKPIGEGVPEAGVVGGATGVALVGGHAAARGARRAAGLEPAPAGAPETSVDQFLRQADEAEARARGAATRAEIDEFIRQKEAERNAPKQSGLALPAPGEPAGRTAAPADAAPSADQALRGAARNDDVRQPGPAEQPNDGVQPAAKSGDGAVGRKPADAVTAENDALRKAGWDDEEIGLMSAKERARELKDAGYEPGAGAPEGTRAKPVKVEAPDDIAPARDVVNTEPTPAQAEAGNYRKGHVTFDGLPVSIENPKGSIRSGTDPGGNAWSVEMPGDYGYIKGTKGADKDHVDILIGGKGPTGKAFVVDQSDPKTGAFDEHKVIAGVNSVGEAARLYSQGFSDGSGPSRIGAITEVPTAHLQEWLAKGRRTKPMAPEPAADEKRPADHPEPAPAPAKDWEDEGRRAYENARERMVPDGLKGEDARAWERGNRAAQAEATKKYLDRARRNAENRMPTTLVQFLRGMGGVIDKGGDLKSQDMHKRFIGLVSSRGVDLDQAREAAAEAGYLGHDKARAVAETTVSDLLDAIMDHPRYSTDDEVQVDDMKRKLADKKHERRIASRKAEISSFMDEHGLQPDPEAVDRAATLMQEEGLSLDDAFERAVVQLAHETPQTREALDATAKEDGFDEIPWSDHVEQVQETAAGTVGGRDQATRGSRQEANERGAPGESDGRPEKPARAGADEAHQERGDEGERGKPDQGAAEVKSPSEDEQHAASRRMEDALDAIEVAQESGDRKAVMEAARNAKRVLAETPAAMKALDPEYWAQFPGAIKRMSADGYKPSTPPAEPTVEPGAEGKPQTVIPGAEKIGQGEQAQRKADEGLKPAVPQKGAGGMFDEAETAPQLFDTPTIEPRDETGYADGKNAGGRDEQNARTGRVDEREGQVLQPEEPKISSVRVSRDNDVSSVGAELSDVSSGRGAETEPAPLSGTTEQQRPLRAGERGLGAPEGASTKHPEEPADRVQRKDASAFGDSGNAGVEPGRSMVADNERVEPRAGAKPAGHVPVENADSIWKDTLPARLGEGTEPSARNHPVSTAKGMAVGESPASKVRDYLLAGGAFRTIVEARAFIKQNGLPETSEGVWRKLADETIEHGVVLAAKEVVERGRAAGASSADVFDKMLRLYENQPRLSSRTSQSVAEQAYSTPVPLAFIASRLAGITRELTVLEPTAGQGALLIEAAPKNSAVNELNKTRADALEAQGFRVMMRDAADPDRFGDVPKVDVVIANPPFGAVREGGESKTFNVQGFRTTNIDHAISLNALAAMKPDGRAVLIIGGVKAENLADRQKGYQAQAKRKFFHTLLQRYKVADIFTVSGDLYERQGAGWPVDVIVIDGVGKTERPPLTLEPPPVLKTWGEVKEKLNGSPSSSEPRRAEDGVPGIRGEEAGPALERPVEAGSRAPAARGGTDARGGGASEPHPAAAPAERVGGKPDVAEPADAGSRELGNEPQPAPRPVRDVPRADRVPDPERGRPVKANEAGQAPYRPASRDADALNTLIPANLAGPAAASLARVERERGNVDDYVSSALGYRPEELRKYFSAEQVDATALALDNIEKGDGFILGDQCVAGETLIYDPVSRTHAQIGVLAAAGRPIVVLSLTRSGFKPTVASAPFYKGVADLFRVTLDDGSSIVVTAGHRFLTEEGWASIRGGLKAGAQIVTDACEQAALSLDSVVSSLPPCAREDDRRSSHTIRDSILHCSPGRRRGDEQSLSAEEADQVFAPSQDDVRGHSLLSSREDGPALSEERSRHRQSPGRPSRNSSFPSESRALSQSATREPALCVSGSAATLQEIAPFPRETAALHQEASAVSTDRHEATDHRLSFSSVDHTGLRRVVSIAYERTDKFYDMHVPATHNYVANHVVNHNTGIGKGRVVAAAIRYAHRKGLVPVFVTEKPDLFGDMWRDLHDIGFDKFLGRPIEMFMTNAGTRVPLDEKAVDWAAAAEAARATGEKIPPREGHFSTSQTTEDSARKMLDLRNGTFKPDVVFTTYDQMNSVKGGETERRAFLRSIAPKAFLIMDEAHNAGGQGESERGDPVGKAVPRAKVFREALTKAQAVLYSSATYAKSPKVMDLFSRTDMSKAVEKPEMLPALIERGGVPLQQIVSSMLGQSGQYLRRERSFEGVSYDLELAPVDPEAYAAFTEGMGKVFRFDKGFSKERKEIAAQIAKERGAGNAMDSGTGEVAANSTEFSSIMHNAIGQMVLSIKAKAAAERAVQALRDGEKPVIALSSTMEAFLTDFAEAAGIKTGDPIELDFGDVLRRYLERTRRITLKAPDANGGEQKTHIIIPLKDMEPSTVAAYKDAEKALTQIDMSGLPISPIDAIRYEIQKAGYTIREITGRDAMVDYSTTPPTYVQRPKGEQGSSGKRVTIKQFNDGALDAVILNKSGSTGVSMHAKDTYKDRRRRRMVLVQADPNIDTHMQMLGRVHRTGQVIAPAYSQLAADIPAEARPTAVLMRKMASLNANTTASRKSKFSGEAVDFMNKYGDRVAESVMREEWQLNEALGEPVRLDAEENPNAMARVTGRLTLLPPDKQQELLDRLTNDYKALIARLDAEGKNDLEAKSVDLQARVLESQVIKAATGPSPFQAEVRLDKVSVKSQGRAMAPDEVLSAVMEAINMKPIEGATFERDLRMVSAAAKVDQQRMIAENVKAAQEHFAKEMAALKKDEAKTKLADRNKAMLVRWQNAAAMAYPGNIVTIRLNDMDMPAVVLSFSKRKNVKNPVALGGWDLKLALPDSTRTFETPLSQMRTSLDTASKGEEDRPLMSPAGYMDTPATLAPLFENARKEGRETRYIFSGNILAAFDQTKGAGQIVNHTMEDGSVRPGILMARKFSSKDFMENRAIRFKDAAQVMKFLDQFPKGEVTSTDETITLRVGNKAIEFDLPSARGTGGKYYADATVRAVYDAWEKRGSRMRAEVSRPKAQAILDAMMKIDAVFETRENQDAALAIINDGARAPQMAQAAPEGWGFSEPGPRTDPARIAADLERIVAQVLPPHSVEARASDRIALRGDEMEAVKRSGGDTRAPHIMGLFSVRHGEKSLLEVATSSQHHKNTTYHEAWHAAQHLGLASEQELAVLRSPAEAARLKRFALQNKGEAAVRGMSQIELEANYFGAYAEALDEGREPPRIHPRSMKIFDRLYELLRRLRNYFKGLGFQTTEDIIRRFQSGEMAKRPFWDRTDSRMYGDEAFKARYPQTGPGPDPRHFAPTTLRQRAMDRFENLPTRDDMVESLLDMHRPVQRTQEGLADGARIAPNNDPYKAKRLLPGRRAAMQEDFRKDYIAPLVEEAKAAKLSRQDIAEWIFARHAPERNEAMDRIDPNNNGRGSGITDSDAFDIIDRLSREGKGGALRNVERRVAAIREYILDTAETSGLLSEDQANELRAAYQNYVPLKGWDDPTLAPEDAQDLRVGGGMRVRGREFRNAFGRKTIAADPLATLINDAYRMIDRATKNDALRTSWRFMKSLTPDAREGVLQLDKGKMIKALDPATGLMRWQEEPGWRFRENVVPLKIGGKPHYIVFDDPAIAQAWMRLTPEQLHWTLSWMGPIVNTAKNFWTHYRPDFIFRHFFMRYPIEGALNAAEGGAGAMVKSFRSYPMGPAFRAIRAHARLDENERAMLATNAASPTATPRDRAMAYYQEMRETGGLMRWSDFGGVERIKRQMERATADLEKRPDRYFLAHARALHEGLDHILSAMDNAQRLQAYIQAREAGASKVDAAMAAREATVDFALKGRIANYLTLIWPFANTAGQTASRLQRAIKRSPAMMLKVLASVATAGFAAGIYAYLMGGNDKDGTPYIEKIGDWTRRLNLVAPAPLMKDAKGRPYMFTLSLPYNFAFPFVFGQTLAAVLMKQFGIAKVGYGQLAHNLFHSALEATTPIAQEDSMVGKFTPELLRPFMHVAMNRNWFGGPVHPSEEPWNKGIPKSERSFSSTGEAWKKLAETMHKYGGPDFHPEDYREVLSYFTSTMQSDVGRLQTAVSDVIAGEKPSPTDIPVAHTMFAGGRQYDQADRRAYYEKRGEALGAATRAKDLQKRASETGQGVDEARQFQQDHAGEIAAAKAFRSTDGSRAALTKQMRRIEADTTLAPDEKKRRLDILKDRELQMMQRMRQRNEAQ